MTDPTPSDPQHPRHYRLTRERGLWLFLASRLFSGIAHTVFTAALFWHVYELSNSALAVGLIGLVRFVPVLSLTLVGGAVADAFDRRRVAILSQCVVLAAGVTLVVATRAGAASVPLLYAVVGVDAIAGAFEFPARQALFPLLVPRFAFPRAVTIGSTVTALSWMLGPLTMGAVTQHWGIATAYAVHAAAILASIVTLLLLRPRFAQAERARITWTTVLQGVAFVRRSQPVLGSMMLDMFAVIMGGATAMLPVYAKDILMVNEFRYGLLTSALETGSFACALVMMLLPPVRRAGRALLLSVAGFGLATVAFGFSRSFWLSVACYMLVGASDQVSVIMRNTIIQLATPDELRGRVSAVNMLFIGASNNLGAVESGFVASLTNATFAVVSGGAGCLAALGVIAARMPRLRHYDVRDHEAAPPA